MVKLIRGRAAGFATHGRERGDWRGVQRIYLSRPGHSRASHAKPRRPHMCSRTASTAIPFPTARCKLSHAWQCILPIRCTHPLFHRRSAETSSPSTYRSCERSTSTPLQHSTCVVLGPCHTQRFTPSPTYRAAHHSTPSPCGAAQRSISSPSGMPPSMAPIWSRKSSSRPCPEISIVLLDALWSQ